MNPPREMLLTLSPEQHRQLAEDVAKLRRERRTLNATQVILDAVREAAGKVAESDQRRAA